MTLTDKDIAILSQELMLWDLIPEEISEKLEEPENVYKLNMRHWETVAGVKDWSKKEVSEAEPPSLRLFLLHQRRLCRFQKNQVLDAELTW